MPSDYVRMAEETEFFIVEHGGSAAGFFNLRRHGPARAEIPLIYLHPERRGKGLGRWSIDFLRSWLHTHWPEVKTLFLDTIIPDYNGGFYERTGFLRTSETSCELSGTPVPAARFEMALESES